MGRRRVRERLVATATPFLEPGERIAVASVAQVAPIAVQHQMALGVATLVLSGGTMAMISVSPKQYVVLTDRRLLFLPMNQLTGRPVAKVTAAIPREVLSASSPQGSITSWVVLRVGDEPQGLRLRFPVPARADARALAEALGAPWTPTGSPPRGSMP